MKLSEFKILLGAHPEFQLIMTLPDGKQVPRHFHVTEVGHVAKNFVDCGGKFRAGEVCVLQTWTGVEQDDGHRLTSGKLVRILGLAKSILPSDELPVEVEYEDGMISQFPVEEVTVKAPLLTVHLGRKHTDCLAKEKCGADGCAAESACCTSGAGQQGCG